MDSEIDGARRFGWLLNPVVIVSAFYSFLYKWNLQGNESWRESHAHEERDGEVVTKIYDSLSHKYNKICSFLSQLTIVIHTINSVTIDIWRSNINIIKTLARALSLTQYKMRIKDLRKNDDSNIHICSKIYL